MIATIEYASAAAATAAPVAETALRKRSRPSDISSPAAEHMKYGTSVLSVSTNLMGSFRLWKYARDQTYQAVGSLSPRQVSWTRGGSISLVKL